MRAGDSVGLVVLVWRGREELRGVLRKEEEDRGGKGQRVETIYLQVGQASLLHHPKTKGRSRDTRVDTDLFRSACRFRDCSTFRT